MELMNGISVIVCCYNSAWIIERCLNALLAQQVPSSVLWEIIVVNNASTDDTERIANKVLQKGHISYQLINEPMQENVELERLDIHILYFVMMTMCFVIFMYQQCMIKWKKILDWERVVA